MSSPLKILFCDADLLILEKPAGLPSLPAKPGIEDPDTVEGLLRKEFPGARLVHRLDNETSGLMAAARNEAAFRKLRKVWNTALVRKTYTAVVEGVPPASGVIRAPIAHHPRKKKKMLVGGKKAKPAETKYRRLKSSGNRALLSVTITTGLRHQIRVHLASIGHPVLGDLIYGKTKNKPRHLLHLSTLILPHPRTGRRVRFESKLPKDFVV